VSAISRRDDSGAILARARSHRAAGRSSEAYAAYLELLSHDGANATALHELGRLAYSEGYRSAARSTYAQIVRHWPRDIAGHINLGNIFYDDGDLRNAQQRFRAALDIDPLSADAHRGLGRIFLASEDFEGADYHWRRSFSGQAVTYQPYRGTGSAIPILLLVSAQGGNIPTHNILDEAVFSVAALYVEYYEPDLPLPPHALIFNAIGDADLCPAALDVAEAIAARSGARIVNAPARIRPTGRAANALRLGTLPGVRAPRMLQVPRSNIGDIDILGYPLLLRSQGFHTGQHFVRAANRNEAMAAAAVLPGDELLAIEYLDARGTDGMARKYRVMFIDGALYPVHLAISADWKVHYFTADMATSATFRAEEQKFLEDMQTVLGAPALAALRRIGECMGLDYCGIDFAISGDGRVIVFEANATMVIHPPSPSVPMWDYRRGSIARALEAAKDLLMTKRRSTA
jgi:hypothetical protein